MISDRLGKSMQNIVAGLIFIDNYEESLQYSDEARRPLIIASIDQIIHSFSQEVDGIVTKFEKDRYHLIFSEEHLNFLIEQKFNVLDQVRSIHIDTGIPITLSIGMGIHGKTLNQTMEFARAAVDLALGRGGDQVVIKSEDEYLFFGGKAKEIDHNTRVRARVKAYALSELITETQNVIVMGHRFPDLDCLGAAIGIHRICETFGKRSNILLNEATSSIRLLYDKLINLEKYKNVFINNETALSLLTPNTLVIIVDCHRPSVLECSEIYEKANRVVLFDHHRKNVEFISDAVLTYHEPYASSTSELVTEMMPYFQIPVKLMCLEADALLAGISVDTKNFAFKTGAKTFEAAAYLRRNGADGIRVRILFQNDREAYRAKSMAVNNAEIFFHNIAISVCPSDVENPALATAQAADELLNISGIGASFVLCHVDDTVLISARSLGDVNVHMIMEKLGGGGHQMVAGAQLSGVTMDEALRKLQDALESIV